MREENVPDHPLVVDAREAKGLADGSITLLVRVMKSQPIVRDGRVVFWTQEYDCPDLGEPVSEWRLRAKRHCSLGSGRPGDRLWVQEDLAVIQTGHSTINAVQQKVPYDPIAVYRADGYRSVAEAIADTAIISGIDGWQASVDHWRAAETMPRWASRTLLDVTNVRVIQIQDITEEDAKAAGMSSDPVMENDIPIGEEFAALYYPTVAVPCSARSRLRMFMCDGHEWDANPFVWLGSVKRTEGA